ncbi:hypothetical protein AZ09_00350 [Acetobacter aceti 1023]|nr:hypothetical protein AZ09_00350 [Acetobacter aceti 1023]
MASRLTNTSAKYGLQSQKDSSSIQPIKPRDQTVLRSLQVMEWRGRPEAIRMDNGPEYVSHTLVSWAEKQGITLIYTQPGNPQQNAYIERYNRTVRQEWLEQYLFESIQDVQEVATQWLWTYNHDRPNMGNSGLTPAQKLKTDA